MNRCFTWLGKRHLYLVPMLLALGITALAQTTLWPQRPFPAKVQRGTMQIVQPPELLLDGKPERLSPGSRIRGTNNMLVMSGSLVGQTLVVHYLRDPYGLIHEVWILTPAEIAAPAPNTPIPPVQP